MLTAVHRGVQVRYERPCSLTWEYIEYGAVHFPAFIHLSSVRAFTLDLSDIIMGRSKILLRQSYYGVGLKKEKKRKEKTVSSTPLAVQ